MVEFESGAFLINTLETLDENIVDNMTNIVDINDVVGNNHFDIIITINTLL